MSNYYLSKCCNAQVTTHEIDRGEPPLNYYAKCQNCGELCDIYPVIDKQ